LVFQSLLDLQHHECRDAGNCGSLGKYGIR